MNVSAKKLVQAHFNQISKLYYHIVQKTFRNYYHLRELETLIAELGRAREVLDVGCASGRYANVLSDLHENIYYVGLDLSKEMISLAKKCKKQSNKEFLVGDIEHLPFRNDTFDVSYAFEVLEHLPKKPSSLVKAICELARIAKYKILIEAPSVQLHPTPLLCFISFLGFEDLVSPVIYRTQVVKQPLAVGDTIPYALLMSILLSKVSNAHFRTIWIGVIPGTIKVRGKLTGYLDTVDRILERLPLIRSFFAREYIIIINLFPYDISEPSRFKNM